MTRSGFATIILVCLAACAVAAQPSIRVGSFMINGLGADPAAEYERSLLSLANIIQEMQVDALAIQGVQDTALGREQVQRLAAILSRAGATNDTPAYEAIFAEPGGGGEIAAFLVRAPLATQAPPRPMLEENPVDSQGRRLFRVMPQALRLQTGDFTFDLLSLHLTIYPFGNDQLQGRAAELEALAHFIREQERGGGPAVVAAGVVNRHLKRNVWDRIQYPGHQEWFRLPLMEAISGAIAEFDPVEDAAPDARFNSVTNQNRRRIWDNLIVSRSAFDRLPDQPEWGVDVGMVAFEQEPEYLWVTGNHADTIRMLSDHRPLWVELKLEADKAKRR